MRGLFGVMILQIASCYGLHVEDDLATIIPNYEKEMESEANE